MNTQRLGCLTPAGFISAILVIAIVAGLTLFLGGTLFSPGALNAQPGNPLGGYTSHAAFQGDCELCHAPFWETGGMSGRCLACHTEISTQLLDPTALHGVIYQNNGTYACQSCHPDHRGPSASLTEFTDGNFPHQALGFSLEGHASHPDGSMFGCKDCHADGYSDFDQANCQACHQQLDMVFSTTHLLSFGENCLACHDGVDTYGGDFDHSLTQFPLTGRHVGAPCTACHLDARTIQDLRSAPPDCFSCHGGEDAHEGRFGSDCASCHITEGWSPAEFDHDLATFKLEGQHIGLECSTCHINDVFVGTPTDCYSCHAGDDAHAGRFGQLCGNCHTASGWKPATFDHNLSAFKLTGQHSQATCEACHVNGVFLGTPTDCYSCHAADDAHAGNYGTGCGSCHTTSGWKPATFDHNLSRFPLTGAHVNLECTQCHSTGSFSGLSAACASCHVDPAFHAGTFPGTPCSECHSTTAWTPASFNRSHPGGCDGNCVDHEDATCRDCHTANLNTATCTKCHDSNNPGDDDD